LAMLAAWAEGVSGEMALPTASAELVWKKERRFIPD